MIDPNSINLVGEPKVCHLGKQLVYMASDGTEQRVYLRGRNHVYLFVSYSRDGRCFAVLFSRCRWATASDRAFYEAKHKREQRAFTAGLDVVIG